VPLDAHDEAQFRRITAQLLDEDPSFGQPPRRWPTWEAFGHTAVLVLMLVAGLALLPVALASGLYPLGMLGYLGATLAVARLATIHPWPWPARSRRQPAEGKPAATPIGRWPRTALAAAGIAILGAAIVGNAGRTAPGSVAETGDRPVTNQVDEATEPANAAAGDRDRPVFARRSLPRVATTTTTP
jgi:hypothetical protein